MGARLIDEELAIQKAHQIPRETRKYISHHVRNGLASIIGAAERLKDEPQAMKDLERYISHIAGDLEKIGL